MLLIKEIIFNYFYRCVDCSTLNFRKFLFFFLIAFALIGIKENVQAQEKKCFVLLSVNSPNLLQQGFIQDCGLNDSKHFIHAKVGTQAIRSKELSQDDMQEIQEVLEEMAKEFPKENATSCAALTRLQIQLKKQSTPVSTCVAPNTQKAKRAIAILIHAYHQK